MSHHKAATRLYHRMKRLQTRHEILKGAAAALERRDEYLVVAEELQTVKRKYHLTREAFVAACERHFASQNVGAQNNG